MKLTQHQKAILEYVGDTEKKKTQIVNRFYSWHYQDNSSRLIGEMLSRMVKAKLLVRVKRGVFKRGTGISLGKQVPVDDNQLSIF